MKILFDHNEPFLLAHGGFQILVEKTADALRREGFDVEYLRWWDAEQRGDIVHFFGRANPGSIHFAHGKGMKYVMHELLTSQGSRRKWQLNLQGCVNRMLRRALPSSFQLPLRWESYKSADAIIASTEWEAWIMQSLFDVPRARLHIVPTGVDEQFFCCANKKQDLKAGCPELRVFASAGDLNSILNARPLAEQSPLVCLATITERKRVLELAEAAVLAGVPLKVIGRPYSESDPYYLKFRKVVRDSGGMVVHDAASSDPAVLAPVLQTARGFVLLSTMETQSTAALAAAAAGCPLLLSDLPWARSTFKEHAWYLGLGGREGTAAGLRRFHDAAPNLPRAPLPLSWSDVASCLANIYTSL